VSDQHPISGDPPAAGDSWIGASWSRDSQEPTPAGTPNGDSPEPPSDEDVAAEGEDGSAEHVGIGRPYEHRPGFGTRQPGWSHPAGATRSGPPASGRPGQPGPPNPGPQPAQPEQPAGPQPADQQHQNPTGQPAPPYWTPRPSDLPPPAPVTRRTGMEAAGFGGGGQPGPPQPTPPPGPQAAHHQPGPPPGQPGPPPGPAHRVPQEPPRGSNFDDDDELLEIDHRRPRPRSGWQGTLYRVTRINLGPSRKDLQELEIRQRLNRQLRRTRGYCGYIGISSEKGGVGKTTLAAMLAAEIAEGRRESVGVADLNPDLGTLPDRLGVRPQHSIRDLLAHVDEIPWRYHVHDFMEKVPEMNVRVLAASTDRKIRHQLSVSDVELLAELFAPFFSFAILDNGTHITHQAMLGTLRIAHGMVLVSDNTKDGANLARKTLQFLTDNGYPDMRRRVVLAVVAKETASPVKVRAIEKAFHDHVRELIIVPYDPALDGGGKIPFRDPNAMNKLLRPQTRAAVRRLAAIVVDDLVA
jgi:MinD-like ATPase involved in chromosome partitioning or flagellar assembly